MKRLIMIIILMALTACQTAEPNVEMLSGNGKLETSGEMVSYQNFGGYLAKPMEGNYPGVVMIHEWWGLNDNIKQMADELAAEGYAVLAVDLYDGKVAETPDTARNYSRSINNEEAVNHLRAAVNYLRASGAENVASLGWCFGGGKSLQLAMSGEPLDATVIYYGSLATDEDELKNINWPVLGIFGDEDSSIPVETVSQFENALNKLKVQNEIHVYEGVGHAFANPSGLNYAPEQTQDAWKKTVEFLKENLK